MAVGNGLIPACAGKTRIRSPFSFTPGAHPRVCGENLGAEKGGDGLAGSSPRVRGKQLILSAMSRLLRLIPACAGKTGRSVFGRSAGGAHPRVCGENHEFLRGQSALAGSSPRVRGKRGFAKCERDCGGLIPACAGKTRMLAIVFNGAAAHPRVCGENFRFLRGYHQLAGSSPRVRGKPARRQRTKRRARLIPACAGKTPTWPPFQTLPKAHPRVCGENVQVAAAGWVVAGSSPRVRGKPTARR